MSTLAYAAITSRRDVAAPHTSTTTSPPGVQTFVDALAALVPTEALALHAGIIAVTTKIDADGVTKISAAGVLGTSFWGLLAVCVALYIVPRLIRQTVDKLDAVRVLIPPAAFIGWMMLQRVTALDAAFPAFAKEADGAARSVAGLFLAVILGFLAVLLAYKADQKAGYVNGTNSGSP